MWNYLWKSGLTALLLLNLTCAFAETPSGDFGEIIYLDVGGGKLMVGDGEMLLDSNIKIHTKATAFSSAAGLKIGMKIRFIARYSKEKQKYIIDEIWEVDKLPGAAADK